MLRSAPRMLALLLVASALTGCGAAGMMGDLTGAPKKEAEIKAKPITAKAAADDLDGNLRQAKLLREAGSYDESIHILSQLMLAAADDPRISAEYGKALAQKGRAQDATQFLRRAIELAPNDWTLYSALGVSYDQLNDPANARMAYEHALALKPADAGVLNNYALSRLMAKDPDGARLLIAQAQVAGGNVPDAKIARNVELINGMAPKTDAEKPIADAVAAAKLPDPKVASAAVTKPAAKLPAPQIVATAQPRAVAPPPPRVAAVAPPPLPPMPAPAMPAPRNNAAPQNSNDVARLLAGQNPVGGADAAPRTLAPQMASNEPPLPPTSSEVAPGVVMQAVPYDPYAGPVTLKKPKPRAVAKADAPKAEVAKADTDKNAAPKPQKTAAAKPNAVPSLRVAVDNY